MMPVDDSLGFPENAVLRPADADSPIPGALMPFCAFFNVFVAALNISLRVLYGGWRG
jgi:hypothetical protein